MRKIPSVFKRDYDQPKRPIIDEVVEACEWVLAGEGIATGKLDGTACLWHIGELWRRYDRRVNKRTGQLKPMPKTWFAAEDEPNEHTGHWPGWVIIGEKDSADKWHIEALRRTLDSCPANLVEGQTYELCGPKVQGNPHGLEHHSLLMHGAAEIDEGSYLPRSFETIRQRLDDLVVYEGIVYHHEDGRMAKIKRRDFGFAWPLP